MKMAKREWVSARWQRRQRVAQIGDAVSLPTPESELRSELRCICSAPLVMWEGEYFCVVTGDLSDKCSGAVTSLVPQH